MNKKQRRTGALALAVLVAAAQPASARDPRSTRTPIEHVIVVVGENHTFDNLFATYQPPHGEKVLNLLSQGIVDDHCNPGRHFARAAQRIANGGTAYAITPQRTGAYATLPQPATSGATGQPRAVPDTRFPADLPNGPFQITKYVPYDAFIGDPAHRFFQMWQQVDDGRHDLFVWVANTINIGSQNFNFGPTPTNLDQGGLAMGFYNMHDGDVPVFRSLAERYAISDNYHQSIMGGTGANFIALVTGHAAFFNLDGVPARPFTQVLLPVVQGYAPAVQVPAPPGLPFKAFGVETEIENPNPNPAVRAATGDSNWYLADGFAGGSYVNCSDPSQAGVAPIRDHLQSLGIAPRCAPDTYYLVNNYEPGYSPAGKLLFKKNPLQALLDPADQNPFRLPPQPATVPTIADALERRGVSWGYFSGGRGDGTHPTAEYCTICDPLTHFTSIMTTPLREHLRDVTDLYALLPDEAKVPAVSFVRPPESQAAHPANASMPGYEAFVADLVARVQANPELWRKTAILVTVDEGGGYYDSGPIQAVDFFGDGTRIPLLAVSPWARKGHVDHTYADHASVLKFVERNWGLPPLTSQARDALPLPIQASDRGDRDAYLPENAPAVGDLFGLFDFGEEERGQDGE
jgi:phospholipase C